MKEEDFKKSVSVLKKFVSAVMKICTAFSKQRKNYPNDLSFDEWQKIEFKKLKSLNESNINRSLYF